MPINAFRNLVAATAFIIPLSLASAAVTSSQITVPMMNNAPQIDGKITAQEKAETASAKLQKNASLDPPAYPTTFYVGATLKGLYVAFIAEEPNLGALVGADTSRNGAVMDDDSVQIFLTPTIDTAADAYYHFAVNPFGVAYSSHLAARAPVDGWQVATSKEAENNSPRGHWEAEFFIPLTTISAPDELPVWRANFARNRPARNDQQAETSAWQDTGISLFNYKKFGYLKMPRFVPAPPRDDNFADSTTGANASASASDVGSTGTATTSMPVMPTPTPSPSQTTGMPVSQPTAQ